MAEVLDTLRPIAGTATADARLEAELGMDSIELATFAAALRARFGDRVELSAHLAGLELDELIELTAGQVAGFVASRLPSRPEPNQPAPNQPARAVAG
jgi:acyl carrier protein